MPGQNERSIKSIKRAFDIVETIKEEEGATLTDLSEAFDRSPSTLYQYLDTMVACELLVKSDGEYDLSHKFLDYSEYARQSNALYDLVQPKVEQLAEQTGERTQFVVPEHGRVVVLQTEVGEQAVRAGVRTGQRLFMHATAAGKAMLAHYPESERDEILDERGLPDLTENTITDEAALMDVLDEVRDRGIAFNDQEDTSGLRAIGAPIRNSDGRPVGALSVSGPSHRLEQEPFESEIIDLLRGTTNEIELRFQYD